MQHMNPRILVSCPARGRGGVGGDCGLLLWCGVARVGDGGVQGLGRRRAWEGEGRWLGFERRRVRATMVVEKTEA